MKFDSYHPGIQFIYKNAEFRKYCEENRCDKYNANYSCPPAGKTGKDIALVAFAI